MRGKNVCRGCGSLNLFQALDLGFSPLANRVILSDQLESSEPWFPVVLRVCSECKLGQLGEFSTGEAIFRDYPYLSSTSSTWLAENEKFTDQMINWLNLNEEDLVLEIASNDGYLLQYFMNRNLKVLGIEPALNVATIAALKGVPTSPEFFTESLAAELLSRKVQPRLIIAKNVLAHVPDIQDFLSGLSLLANENSLIVVEAPSILNILQKMQFDTIYHEHFSYLSATFLNQVLPQIRLKLVGVENVETHGGSQRYFITKNISSVTIPDHLIRELATTLDLEKSSKFENFDTWSDIETAVQAHLLEIRNWFASQKNRIIGYGAAAKVVTLLSASQIPRGAVSFCIDNSEAKVNRYIPGSHIKIISENDYAKNHQEENDIYVIFPWNLTSEISKRLRTFAPEAKIFVLLPSVQQL